jgi:carbon-monoxide dehydrogenase large subunit
VYTDDLRLPELDGAARITGIDTEAALASPGVVAVLTAADMDDIPSGGDRPTTEPLLATDRVRYVGEAVAIVVTEQGYQGEDAAELVSVELRPAACGGGLRRRAGRRHAAVRRDRLQRDPHRW